MNMYIQGPLKSGKTSALVDKYIELITSGVSTSKILVLCANKVKQKYFTQKVREKLQSLDLQGFGSFNIYTFNGIVYNSILKNWPTVESLILKFNDNSQILPNLSGLHITEYLLKLCIKEINTNPNNKTGFRDYFSEENLIHQLLRRYRLITENCLDQKEINLKSEILDQQFFHQANLSLDKLKNKTLSLRVFDYLKQTNTFLYLLNNDLIEDFNNIEFLFGDDLDELSYAAHHFLKKIIPKTKQVFLAYDKDGGSRRGYLCAHSNGWEEIRLFKDANLTVEKICNKQTYNDAISLFEAIKSDSRRALERISLISLNKRAEMIEQITNKIISLLNSMDTQPEDIIIVSPKIDENLKNLLQDFFERNYIQYHFLIGTKKIIEDKYVFGSIIIAQLINKKWNLKPKPFEIQILFRDMFNFPSEECEKTIKSYKEYRDLNPKISFDKNDLNQKYQILINLIEKHISENFSLYEQFLDIFNQIIIKEVKENSCLNNFNIMINSLKDFLYITNKIKDKSKFAEKEWIVQLKNTVVYDNPVSTPDIKPQSLIIGTPQRIIDFEIESKYQIWLDISSDIWTKDDIGPLYNSWVFQKSWDTSQEYSLEAHNKLTIQKTSHVLRKLVLCANERIFAYSSSFDSSGFQNNGILAKYISLDQKDNSIDFNFTPREDQKSVLDYKQGFMAVAAVPGAGKTTVNQALIIKLIKEGVKPSEILVLTYMESAARNIENKIKQSCPGLGEFPYISTIHGLAHKIIRDENNFLKLGLSSDFEICDDSVKIKILQDICSLHLPEGESLKDWINFNQEAISHAKFINITPKNMESHLKHNNNFQELKEFYAVYDEYLKILKHQNLIDFDDLLHLCVKLLKDHKEVRNHYQSIYKYIIEDEAQDSSNIQQELIYIISAKHGNIVRTGDVNQAITKTFSNADVEGFKEFINKSQKVEMNQSQRCAKSIYDLANKLVEFSLKDENLNNSFYPIYMKPVSDKNPKIDDSIKLNIFESSEEEQKYIIREIQKIQNNNKSAKIGILQRNNFQVLKWAALFDKKNISYICITDNLGQKKAFKIVFKYLEFLLSPFKNKIVVELFNELVESGIYKKSLLSNEFLSKLGSPFISFSIEDLPYSELSRFYMDLQYWMEMSTLPPQDLILKLGYYYFEDIVNRSNVQLISILVSRYRSKFTSYSENITINLPEIFNYLADLKRKNRISGLKIFDEAENYTTDDNNFAEIMTVHKSKGLAFDFVFMPEMSEDMYSYCITPENIKIKAKARILSQLERINPSKNKIKSSFDYKIEQAQEHMRLVYVGITRAKKYLYMSSSKKIEKWGKIQDNHPSRILEYFVQVI